MPRTVNLISGPSRSGDIEQKIILGAHGPRALHIIVVGGDGRRRHQLNRRERPGRHAASTRSAMCTAG